MREEKILVVDSDVTVRRLIWKCLQPTGILIYQSDSVEKTLDIMTRVDFQLFLLDSNLEHEKDGYHLVQMIRQLDPVTPIIFITEENKTEEIILGLESGADYYITKPFNPEILKAQILTTLDRQENILKLKMLPKKTEVVLGDFRVDKTNYQLYQKGEQVKLSAKEFQLLTFFLENPNQVFTKEEIYHRIWNGKMTDNNTLTVFINHLRNKIEKNPQKPQYLQTIWGVGYRFNPEILERDVN